MIFCRSKYKIYPLVHFLLFIGLLLVGCTSEEETFNLNTITIGVVSYSEGTISIDKYERFRDYIAEQTKAIVELEPVYNELRAIDQIKRKSWSIVFAPPGLAAIAIGEELYVPIFPLEDVSSLERSLILVRQDSRIQNLKNLANKRVALEQPGSAAGYYLPLYDLYGLTLANIRFASTPKTVLEWIAEGTVDAGALSQNDFDTYKKQLAPIKFRILRKSRPIPSGVVLVGPTVERNLQERIKAAMEEAPSDIIGDAGYVPTAPVPDYEEFIKLVEKVKPLEDKVKQTPAVLIKPQ